MIFDGLGLDWNGEVTVSHFTKSGAPEELTLVIGLPRYPRLGHMRLEFRRGRYNLVEAKDQYDRTFFQVVKAAQETQ